MRNLKWPLKSDSKNDSPNASKTKTKGKDYTVPERDNFSTKMLGATKRKWLHEPEKLISSHALYLVKFLGSTEVDKPKGIDVVKQGVQKLKFNQQLKKSEGGPNKTPKVELSINIEGVTIQEPKTKKLLHQYPLYKISYCADDKAEKRFFSFIAKEGDTNTHTCFVFVSDKKAEEITLTIGQAFELAYKKYMDKSGAELELRKQLLVTKKRVTLLEKENAELKKRLVDVANIKGQQDIQQYLKEKELSEITEIRPVPVTSSSSVSLPSPSIKASSSSSKVDLTSENSKTDLTSETSKNELINLDVDSSNAKLDGFTLDDLNDDDFNPREEEGSGSESDDGNVFTAPPPATTAPKIPPILPPRENVSGTNMQQNLADFFAKDDPFSAKTNPFSASASANPLPQSASPFAASSTGFAAQDPFGMDSFQNSVNVSKNSNNSLADAVKNFSLEELDPLKK